MKLIKLHRIAKYPDRQLWAFNLGLEGFIVNGFVFNAETGSIMSPVYKMGGKSIRIVKGFGIHWKRLKQLLLEEIANKE
jgi:hypothetical protein